MREWTGTVVMEEMSHEEGTEMKVRIAGERHKIMK